MAHFKTYFGVPLPTFRSESHGDGAFTIRFVLKGRVVSKKNKQMAVCRRKEAKEYIRELQRTKGSITGADAERAIDMVVAKMIGNIQYREFLKHFQPIIQEQMKWWEGRLGSKGLKFPLRKAALTLKFYFADRHVTDTVNKQQSVQDLLVDCGVIANDDYCTLNPILSESASYFGELRENICLILLYFKVENIENEEQGKTAKKETIK